MKKKLRRRDEVVKPEGPAGILAAGAETFIKKSSEYGNSVRQYGDVMTALFPEGVTLDTPQAWTHMGVFQQVVHKVCRAANTMVAGQPSVDSAHDMMVYSAILQDLYEEYVPEEE